MRHAYRVDGVRAAEAALMARLPDGTLMARAAHGLARRAALMLGRVYGSRVLLLAGPGDNGGDALYAGAILARRGAAVTAVPLNDRFHPGGAAALRRAGGRVTREVPAGPWALVVDGLFGIGGRAGLPPAAAALLDAAGRDAPVLAVDVPSGVDADTGAVDGPCVTADVTVTFGALKPALVAGAAHAHAGLVELHDIGLRPHLPPEPYASVPGAADIAARWRHPGPRDDKYTRGVAGIAAGSARYPGAALLAVAGALAGPAGYLRYAGPAAATVADHHPEVVTTDDVAAAGRVQAWAAGPGLGTGPDALAALRAVLAAPVPVVLDADALTLLAGEPGLLDGRDAPTVLTPHDREYARLLGGEPPADRIAAARALADRYGAVALLKGDRTVVTGPDGPAHVNPTGHPALGTAGTGDVLTGLIAAVLASGTGPADAALTAAYVHGLAGRRAAADGPVTATRVAAALRPAVRDLTGPE